MNEKFLEDKYVENWFEQIGNSRTIRNYTREFPRFLEFVKKTHLLSVSKKEK